MLSSSSREKWQSQEEEDKALHLLSRERWQSSLLFSLEETKRRAISLGSEATTHVNQTRTDPQILKISRTLRFQNVVNIGRLPPSISPRCSRPARPSISARSRSSRSARSSRSSRPSIYARPSFILISSRSSRSSRSLTPPWLVLNDFHFTNSFSEILIQY